MDQTGLAAFLRTRREALQPADVGFPAGHRRRTPGLRREEVAVLCQMSTDYYSRLERGRGPRPSEQMIASIARGLRLTLDERDHLFVLAGHNAPARATRSDHVNAGMMRILDRLQDTPAQIVTGIGETLVQTPLAVALLGDQTHFTGPERSLFHRWFTDPGERGRYVPEDHATHSRVYVAQLRAVAAREGSGSRADLLARELRTASPEFAALWARHEVGVTYTNRKGIIHPELGRISLYCQTLVDPDQSQSLLVFTATPGTEDHDKLQLLSVIGSQHLAT
ncbi:helix-turn-helix transcriptional regulator [Streptomyces cylindrosporus]|uniref:Helix-turn-helix transcriptional regulator n=1 Tax=Streptomyces cylindrosporus TaxID=2927583 RepID=A0ABS9YMY6_9ACTN|nr:helix-turn-helix transcriptional regulator [Streptomyces cylindrosporus]MCI3278631.1 helix-turn-helix transcriptional regulator [Streptomyces cylindrosporus]